MAKCLVVNADDLGISRSVNAAVRDAHRCGVVTSASLMPSMPHAAHALDTVVRPHAELGIGLHLCLTSGRPVMPASQLPLLVDDHGHFCRGFARLNLLLQSPWRDEAVRQIRREVRAQVAHADSWPRSIDHIDSHQHVHMIPAVFALVAPVAAERKVALRLPCETIGSVRRFLRRSARWMVSGQMLKHLVVRNCTRRGSGSLPPVDRNRRYFGLLDSGCMNRSAWRMIIRCLDEGTTEINVHPSRPPTGPESLVCSAADRRFLRARNRPRELEMLVDPRLYRWIRDSGTTLVRHADVPAWRDRTEQSCSAAARDRQVVRSIAQLRSAPARRGGGGQEHARCTIVPAE